MRTVSKMQSIDARLLDCVTQPDMTENFNRVLALADALTATVGALEQRVAALEPSGSAEEGPIGT